VIGWCAMHEAMVTIYASLYYKRRSVDHGIPADRLQPRPAVGDGSGGYRADLEAWLAQGSRLPCAGGRRVCEQADAERSEAQLRCACQSSTSRPNESSPGSSTGLPSCSTHACARNSGVVRAPMTSFAWMPRLASRRVSTSERIRQRVSPGTCASSRPTARPRRRASVSESAAGAVADGDRERRPATTDSIGARRNARRDCAYAARISTASRARAVWLRRSTRSSRTIAILGASALCRSELGTAI